MVETRGFTLMETMAAIFTIVAAAVVVSFVVDPASRLAEGRNDKRMLELNAILDSVQQYKFDHGRWPQEIDDEPGVFQVLGNGNTSCGGGCQAGPTASSCLDLSSDLGKYMTAIPNDPKQLTGDRTMYAIDKTEDGKIKLVACNAELGRKITVQK